MLLALILSTASTKATDSGYPYRPKRLVFEFASPFIEPYDEKVPDAKVIVEARQDSAGHFLSDDLHYTQIASIDVIIGKQTLSVPKTLLRDLGEADLTTVLFVWGGPNRSLKLTYGPRNGTPNLLRVTWTKEGKLIFVYLGRLNCSEEYIKSDTPEHKPQ